MKEDTVKKKRLLANFVEKAYNLLSSPGEPIVQMVRKIKKRRWRKHG